MLFRSNTNHNVLEAAGPSLQPPLITFWLRGASPTAACLYACSSAQCRAHPALISRAFDLMWCIIDSPRKHTWLTAGQQSPWCPLLLWREHVSCWQRWTEFKRSLTHHMRDSYSNSTQPPFLSILMYFLVVKPTSFLLPTGRDGDSVIDSHRVRIFPCTSHCGSRVGVQGSAWAW